MTRKLPDPDPDPVSEARGRPLAEAVLELIWREREITRADIARATGLARSTVSEVVSRLLDSGLIREQGDAPSRGGRRAVLLRFEDDARVILGVDMGASHVGVALTNLRGRTLHWEEVSHPVQTDPDGTCALIERMCRTAIADVPDADSRLIGIGIGVPAPIDLENPDDLSDAVLPAWKGNRGLSGIAERLGVPFVIENDANVGALAEHWWGEAVDVPDFTYIKVATGVGSGLILGGEIYRGAGGVAGEIGHVSIDPSGPMCSCGNRGCLTTMVGTAYILQRVRELHSEHPNTKLDSGAVSLNDLVQATLDEDPLALAVIEEAASRLGTAIAGLLNLLNPGAVILGGSLTQVGRYLLDPLREAVSSRTLVDSVLDARIETSRLGDRNVALGAATLVLSHAFERPSIFKPSRVA